MKVLDVLVNSVLVRIRDIFTMYDILFDEKIYGSNHLTLGKDYEVAQWQQQ